MRWRESRAALYNQALVWTSSSPLSCGAGYLWPLRNDTEASPNIQNRCIKFCWKCSTVPQLSSQPPQKLMHSSETEDSSTECNIIVTADVVPIIEPNQLKPYLLNISGSYFLTAKVVMSKTTFLGMRYLLECELSLANVKKHHVYALRKTLLCVPDLAHHSEVALNPSVSQETEK